MELHQLRYFLTTLEEGSFSRAAARHRLTQQAVSKSIGQLEEELGTKLFQRDGRQLNLTAAGKMLAEHAQVIDAESHQFQRHLSELLGTAPGQLEIGAGPTAAGGLVAETVRQLLNEDPSISVSIVEGTTSSMTPQLKRGELDAFVSVLAQRAADTGLVCDVLYSEPTVLVGRAAHPLAGPSPVELADTLEFPWLSGTGMDHWGDLVRSSFVSLGLKPPVPSLKTSSVSFARALLARTDHLSVLPVELVQPDLDTNQLAIINIPEDWSRPMALFYRGNLTHSPAVRTFIAKLKATAKRFTHPAANQTG